MNDASVARPPGARVRSRMGCAAAVLIVLIAAVELLVVLVVAGPEAVLLVAVFAGIPPLGLAAIIRWFDRWEPEPPGLLALTFGFGATGSIVLSLIGSAIAGRVVSTAMSAGAGQYVGVVWIAPIVEELAKGLAVFVVFWRMKGRHFGVVDGIVYGTMVGLGFAFAENILYYLGALADGTSFGALVFLRGVMGVFGHPLYTSLTGIGIAVAAASRRARYAGPLLGLAGAMALHAIWNGSTFLGQDFFLVYFYFFMPVLSVVVIATWVAARHERRVLAASLGGDVVAGLLTANDVAELVSIRSRRAAVKAAARQGGPVARDARKAFQNAAVQLAMARHVAGSKGPDPAREMTWVREIARYKRWVNPAWIAPAGID
jgi:RsiW-degrading membrane proteinase PrsW (M82 family)